MRAKRDQRPLLKHEAPMLSDQMPLGSYEEERQQQQQHHQQHLNNNTNNNQGEGGNGKLQKKGAWRRLFGKGSKRKENQNPQSAALDGGESGLEFSQSHSSSSASDNADYSLSKTEQQQQHRQSSNGSDKRDDNTESSSNHVHEMLDNEQQPPVYKGSMRSPTSSKKGIATMPSRSTPEKATSPASRSSDRPSPRSSVSPRAGGGTGANVPRHSSGAKNPRIEGGDGDGSGGVGSPPSKNWINYTSSTIHSNENKSLSGSPQSPQKLDKILSRPFGREHITLAAQTWVVQVARAEWEPDEALWKYRITIQKRQGNKLHDFANGFTLRSLQDFHWLEQALTAEFFGGLLLPSLSICLGVPDILTCQHEVDSRLLANWLSDILNGVRGQGEILFKMEKIEVATCESMDAFLYRSDLVHHIETPRTPGSPTPKSRKDGTNPKCGGGDEGKWTAFFPELCYGDCAKPPSPVAEAMKTPVNIIKNCSTPELGSGRRSNVQNSIAHTTTFDDMNSALALHSDLLKAERDLIWSWRTRSLMAMEKLRILQEQEKHIGGSWKRFAISVSNLFAYEKDVETARLGDSKSRRELQMPYKKLQKSAVDDCLRILARQKVERSTPSIEAINVMLSAYVADLSTVQPSVRAYLEGLQQLALQKSKTDSLEADHAEVTRESSDTLAGKIHASFKEVQKQFTAVQDDPYGTGKKDEERMHRQRQRVQTIENRVLMNEALLKEYMTTFCRTAPIRTARMIHSYLEKETAQCAALYEASVDMRGKINVTSKETLSKMIQRHHIETKEDRNAEILLVHRIVNIGNTKKFPKDDDEGNAEEVERGVELSRELAEEEALKAKLREHAMDQCNQRIGRWDAKLAMAIMEAVGVSDANVRVEETTRDLRMVRKYAIGLRENVQRCVDALEILRMSILQGGMGDIRDLRADFMSEMQNLLSLAYIPVDDQRQHLPIRLLESEDIDLSDPAGWRSRDNGTCGNAITAYMETRDSGTEWLLESLGELLKEYNQRVEAVESFVYMECVGIQLEKHFSQARATALAAFEKKTDITSAINIATRKKMPVLVKELQAKLVAVGTEVSHTTVKEAKEAHLESKTMKQDLHDLAMRRLTRARETSTERAIALMTVWSKEEEGSTSTELEILKDLMVLLQKSVREEEIGFYVDASPARM